MNRKLLRRIRWPLAASVLLFATILSADVVPHVFSPGTRILSTQVNENFQDILSRIDRKQDKLLGQSIAGTVGGKYALTVTNDATLTSDCSLAGGAIHGTTSSHFCGSWGWAGVHGESKAADSAVGVLGSAGSATAQNAVGVLGMASGANAAGLATWGTGVQINGGGIRVNRAWKPLAFGHTANTGNSNGNVTCIDQELTNGDPNAVLTATHRLSNPPVYLGVPIGLQYDEVKAKWCIHAEDGTTSLVGHTFNVIVINTFAE